MTAVWSQVHGEHAGAVRRRHERRLRQFLRHERLSVAMALAEYSHHTSRENYEPRQLNPPLFQAAWRPALLSVIAGPQERVQRIAELIVVCQCHRSWRNRGGDSASGECLHDADCGLVPQIVRASWISSSGMTVPTIFFHEPSMTHSSSSSRARRAGVAGSFTLR